MKSASLFLAIFIFLYLQNYVDVKNEESISKIPIELRGNNDTEDYFPMRYINDQESGEVFAHSNRVILCEDHSLAMNICVKANTSSLCQTNEVYAFSFCRKSCGFCKEVDNFKHSMWRIVPGTSFKPTWAISEVKFYKKHHLEDIELEISSVFSSSQYDGYETHFAFDNNSDTFWMPESWGNHDPGSEWIGANLSEKEKVHAVQLKIKNIDGAELPKYIHIESSNSQYESFIRRWTYHINKDEPNKVYYKPACPPLWKLYTGEDNTYCAKIFWKHLTWIQANSECKKQAANLISFPNSNHLSIFIKKFLLKSPVWIGLNDIKDEGKFEWSDGSKFDFFAWDNGELDEDIRKDNEDCVYLNKNGKFVTSVCSNQYFYVCEKPYSKYIEPTSDPRLPEVISPIIFKADNYYDPEINIQKIEELSTNKTFNWPVLAEIPITMDKNTTYDNRFEKLPNKIEIINEEGYNKSENEKIESPIHRDIQNRDQNINNFLFG